jgi:formylglycine-generating enzyme
MTLIYTPDTLRTQVEAASGGLNTVIYDTFGNPNYMRVVHKYNVEDIDAGLGTGVHPAFEIWNSGTEQFEERPYFMIGQYLNSNLGGKAVSLPGRDPWATDSGTSQTFDFFKARCDEKGAGWHLVTNVEWAAIALWCWKNGFQPRGNSDWGRDIDAPHETGYRIDGLPIGSTSGTGRTATGSGPVSWRHDNTIAGIADLNGNISEWQGGLRMNVDEIQIFERNRGASTGADNSASSALWRAIDGETGDLVAPGHANAVKYVASASGTGAYRLYCANNTPFQSMTNSAGGSPVSAAALQVLKRYGLFPVATSGLDGHFFISISGERVAHRGGSRSHGAGAGVAHLTLGTARSTTAANLGARSAFAP